MVCPRTASACHPVDARDLTAIFSLHDEALAECQDPVHDLPGSVITGSQLATAGAVNRFLDLFQQSFALQNRRQSLLRA